MNHMLGFAPSLRFLWQQNSVPTLQKTIGSDCKPSTLMCMRRQKDHIHTLKIMWSMSDFSGLWYYHNNKACTDRPNEHNYTVSTSAVNFCMAARRTQKVTLRRQQCHKAPARSQPITAVSTPYQCKSKCTMYCFTHSFIVTYNCSVHGVHRK